jgi:predicted nucleic acid-binding protein
MRIEQVVVNASPLIVLMRSGQAELLPQLFREIVIPEVVWQEVVAGGHLDQAALGLQAAPWAKPTPVGLSPRVTAWNLGAGESAVLTFALENPRYRAVLDDRAARRCASTLGIAILGTGGVLVLAKRRSLLRSVKEGLDQLQQAGLWLSPEIINLLMKEAGEL